MVLWNPRQYLLMVCTLKEPMADSGLGENFTSYKGYISYAMRRGILVSSFGAS